MRYVKIKNLEPGMRLGIGLYDISGNEIYGVGKELSSSIIAQLDADSYTGVYIEDELSKDIENDMRFCASFYAPKTDAIVTKNYAELMRIATAIVDDMVYNQPEKLSIIKLHSKKEYLFYHNLNVALYSVAIGQELGLDREGLYYLAKAAIMHDIGLLEISPDVVEKINPTEEEQAMIKRHAQFSVSTIKKLDPNIDEIIVDAIMAHHENENGSGFPNRLESDDIPDLAKIIHVADTLDLMTTRVDGRDAYLPADAFDYLQSGAGILFHEDVVEAAINKFDAYPIGAEVTLSNEKRAIVAGRSRDRLRPIVILTDTGEKVRLYDDENYKFIGIKSTTFEMERALKNASLIAGGEANVKHTIVVVDDVYVCRRTVESALSNDYNVKSFDNAISALGYIRSNPVSLVIMDIEMPELDGITAVRRLRKDGFTNMPVIFLTSVNDKKTVMDCLEVGACDYILKPIMQIYVYERVKEALK